MKVLIVGGGIGGLTLAGFLEGSNIECEVVEKAPQFEWSHQGFLIGIWQYGRNVLKKLNLADAFDGSGQPVRKFMIKNGKGDPIYEYDFEEFYTEYGGAMRLIERAALHEWLLQKIDPKKIMMGTTIETIVQDAEKATVTFSNKLTKTYDLVVGADGVHSSVRNKFFKDTEHFANWRLWCSWIEKKFDTNTHMTEYIESGALGVILSSGTKAMIWLVAPADHTMWDSEEGRKDRLKEIFKSETVFMPNILEKINDGDILPSDLIEVKLKKWTAGRVTLLGDAAHSFGPHAGIGGSMAMEDAYVLASELFRVGPGLTLTQALKDYEKKRKKRIKIATRLSYKFKRMTLVKSKPFRKIMNFLLPRIPTFILMRDYKILLRNEI
jgi:2-polyprenyl-6-methoxyphenol hydroxylase-like FAD-dependent oxidoreductase